MSCFLSLPHGPRRQVAAALGTLAALLAPAITRAVPLVPPAACTATTGDAAAVLGRAAAVAGLPASGRVLRYAFRDLVTQDFQSDRPYPPYLVLEWGGTFWSDPAARTQRLEEQPFGMGQQAPRPLVLVHGAGATYAARDTALAPFPGGHALSLRARPLDAWTVIADWRTAFGQGTGAPRVVARCPYREWPRVVLERAGADGPERLFVDPKSGLPVKLERREPHALWGEVRVEYLWTNWEAVAGARAPLAAYRLVDGAVDITRLIGPPVLVPRDSAPPLAVPANAPTTLTGAPDASRPDADRPDTVRVGAHAFLLVSRAYTSAVVLARDTVWVLDATLGERRATADAEWVARLFPGRHPVAVVVTDLAWPHVAGVRHWVARGATVVSHAASEPFLRRVVARRWTLAPDSLERLRRVRPAAAALRFRAVRESLTVAGGALALHAIDGLGSEGALMAWLPGDHFLWAGDFVQTVQAPSAYAAEVVAAVQRARLGPTRVAAMHLPVTPWAAVAALHPPVHGEAVRSY